MTPDEARAHLERLEISQQAFARLVGISPQHFRKMLRQIEPLEIPRAVELLLPLLTPARIRRLVRERKASANAQRGPVVR
jgi:ribosomal protein L22